MDRRKLFAFIGIWAVILSFQVYWFLEPQRMTTAEQRIREESATRGAELYASNCMVCHGPVGEGVIGPPLNRPDFRAEQLEDFQIEDTKNLIRETIARGRDGTTIPSWEHHADGTITSTTQMPTWLRAEGGSLNSQMVDDLVNFIMYGNWQDAGNPEYRPEPNEEAAIPQPEGVSDDLYERGSTLLVEKQCTGCHTFGRRGAVFGPDLTNVGDWMTEEKLRQWIDNPQETPERMPRFWAGGADTEEIDPSQYPTIMPNIDMTEEELDTIVRFLMQFKAENLE